ncbi:GTPase, G3E family [Paenisporosarcina quisquiliarum]|nr:GTPase, G3E family [Paenisporosarcina quisquiliarum]
MGTPTKIPVYILGGFLGSGKTTVLLKMLEHCKEKGQKPGIILNELGSENVEGHLFEGRKVFELLDGCICCTIQDDLKETMNMLIEEMNRSSLDVLFIEGTGVANPLEIQEVLLGDPYIDQFEIMSIITVLDASNYLEYQSFFTSSAEVRNLMKEQIICGSLLLLNKTDLIHFKQLEKVINKIEEIAGKDKEIIPCTNGIVDPKILFDKRFQSFSINPFQTDINSHHHDHHSTVFAFKLEGIPSLPKKTFEKWFKELPSNVLRGKGYIQIENSSDLLSFQLASKKVKFIPVPFTNNKKTVIILIGTDLHNEDLNNHFKLLLEGVL